MEVWSSHPPLRLPYLNGTWHGVACDARAVHARRAFRGQRSHVHLVHPQGRHRHSHPRLSNLCHSSGDPTVVIITIIVTIASPFTSIFCSLLCKRLSTTTRPGAMRRTTWGLASILTIWWDSTMLGDFSINFQRFWESLERFLKTIFHPRLILYSNWFQLQDMPTDNDNEGPGLGLGDLNDIFNDDPFSNVGAESPTGDYHHHLYLYHDHQHHIKMYFQLLFPAHFHLKIHDRNPNWPTGTFQARSPARRETATRATRRANCLAAILLSGWSQVLTNILLFISSFVCL